MILDQSVQRMHTLWVKNTSFGIFAYKKITNMADVTQWMWTDIDSHYIILKALYCNVRGWNFEEVHKGTQVIINY